MYYCLCLLTSEKIFDSYIFYYITNRDNWIIQDLVYSIIILFYYIRKYGSSSKGRMHFRKLVRDIRDSINIAQNGKEVNKCHLSAQVMENRYFLISDKLKKEILYLFNMGCRL